MSISDLYQKHLKKICPTPNFLMVVYGKYFTFCTKMCFILLLQEYVQHFLWPWELNHLLLTFMYLADAFIKETDTAFNL